MIGVAWLCVVMASAVAAPIPATDVAKPRPQVLVMDLEGVGVDAQDVVAATRIVTAAAAEVDGIDVMSAADLRRLADMEVDRQNAGCGDDTSCVADIAGALGAEFVVFGSLSRLGSQATGSLAVYSSRSHQVERRSFVADDVGQLGKGLRRETIALLTGGAIADVAIEDRQGVLGLGVAASGAVLVVGGGIVLFVANDQILKTDALQADKEAARNLGLGGAVAAVVGVVALAVGAVMWGSAE